MRTIEKIIYKVDTYRGAPMGRNNVGEFPHAVISGRNGKIFKKNQKRVFDCAVPMNGAYDSGGAYWGLGHQLRVSYTKDLSYINFYRIR